jgi:hypothetical protein
MILLTDDKLDAVMNACKPLAPGHRDELLRVIANELSARRDHRDGVWCRFSVALSSQAIPGSTPSQHATMEGQRPIKDSVPVEWSQSPPLPAFMTFDERWCAPCLRGIP